MIMRLRAILDGIELSVRKNPRHRFSLVFVIVEDLVDITLNLEELRKGLTEQT